MPIKVYECGHCGTVVEVLIPPEKIRRKCPDCGRRMYRAICLEGVQIDGETVTGKRLK